MNICKPPNLITFPILLATVNSLIQPSAYSPEITSGLNFVFIVPLIFRVVLSHAWIPKQYCVYFCLLF